VPRALLVWLTAGWAGLLIVPWYGLDGGIAPPALFASRIWLLPLALPLLLATWAALAHRSPRPLVAAGAAGLVWLVGEGLLIIHRGWTYAWLAGVFGEGPSQHAMGWGAALYALACLMLLAHGLARLGACKGDVFVTA
jgi:iron(III) transport system permease protein